jgi:hypothetical protein
MYSYVGLWLRMYYDQTIESASLATNGSASLILGTVLKRSMVELSSSSWYSCASSQLPLGTTKSIADLRQILITEAQLVPEIPIQSAFHLRLRS